MLSPEGRCKAFDTSADGFVPGEGVGVLVLKRLDAARRDHDRIHAVIRGSGINQDGKTNGITAPSAQSQAALESSVYRRFGLDPSTFTYVEAHGTGTKLGDPIEIDALTESFQQYTQNKRFCAIGSVKSNIGHGLPSAGIAGLIKTVLALTRWQIPPSLHCARENEHIDFANSPFFVNRKLLSWSMPECGVRRAAVSSFGFSGTNAHIVVEEFPANPRSPLPDSVSPRVYCLSAKTQDALLQRVADLESWLAADGGQSQLDDLSYTLNMRRPSLRRRVAFVASTRWELMEQLRAWRETGKAPAIVGSSPLEETARAWVGGAAVDWARIIPKGTLLSLPGYPFERRLCWSKAKADELTPANQPAAVHPMLELVQPGVGTACASKQFTGDEKVLRDHRVLGQPVMPAAGYLEMVWAAAQQLEKARPVTELRNVYFKAPFQLREATQLRVGLFPAGDKVRFECASAVTHAEGECVAAGTELETDAAAPLDVSAIAQRCSMEYSADAVYAAFEAMGLSYGPSFRCIQSLRVGKGEALSTLSVSEETATYYAPPGVLDSALQTLIGFALDRKVAGEPMLPFALERFRIYSQPKGTCYAYARATTGGDNPAFDVQIFDDSGRLLVTIEGFVARRLRADAVQYLQPVWEKAPLDAAQTAIHSEAILVFRAKQDFGLAAALAKAHVGAQTIPVILGNAFHPLIGSEPAEVDCSREVDFERLLEAAPSISRVYFLGGLATQATLDPGEIASFQQQSVLALFRFVKVMTRIGRSAPVYIVSNNVHAIGDQDRIYPQAGALSGFARVAASELRDMPFVVVDVSATDLLADAASLATSIAREVPDPVSPDFAWRGGVRYRRTLQPLSNLTTSTPRFRENAVYVIPGGIGGIGLVFARHICHEHHARVALIGRSPLDENRQRTLDELNASGGEAIYLKADVTDLASMRDARQQVIERWGQVNGLIHSAFVLRDRTLVRMEESEFREALEPKISGTSTALAVFAEDKLDWALLFSSSISFTGSPGQSNYAAGSTFQDGIGQAWNQAGRFPVRVINWSYWGSVGAVTSASHRHRAEALGVGSIEPAEGIEAVGRILEGTAPQVVVLKRSAKAPAARDSVPAAKAASNGSGGKAYVRRLLGEVLKMNDADFDADQPFDEYGVDSLVAINVLNKLEADYGSLPKTLLFEQNTISALASYLSEVRAPKAVVAPPSILLPIRETGSAPRTFWVHSVVGEMNWAVRLAHHMGQEWPVYGFQSSALVNGRPAYARLEEMAEVYVREMRAIQPRGPYYIGGFSFGGSVALEMALQLERAGERVAWMVLLDAYAPGSQALESLVSFNWDGFLPQVIANMMVKQWKGSGLLDAAALPKDDPEAQVAIAARHVRQVCTLPQTEAEIAAAMMHSVRLANVHAVLQRDYVARRCEAVEHTVLFRNRFGFVGEGSELGLPVTQVNDKEPDHGWGKWVQSPILCEMETDHFSLGLEPAIGLVGKKVAELIGSNGAGRREQVFAAVKRHALRLLLDVPPEAITLDVRLKDLGANSLDRVEIATCVMEELNLQVPRPLLAGVEDVRSLVEVLAGEYLCERES
jgi:thioesterase domain-containing protein/acyl carrier protein/NADP-dependent 3-hydroxy acid dehydrogenase YdfG